MGSETRRAAQQVYDCLLQMGQQDSNPVLQLFEAGQAPIENKKYPAGFLQFNRCGWRAYYHSHPASGHGRSGKHCFDHEHGHFHIFVQIGTDPEAWSHLVALSIDPLGQPQGWFTVNHWVTGELWQDARALTGKLAEISYVKQDDLLQRWLLAMVALESKSIGLLLQQRDKLLDSKISTSNGSDVRQDKGVYLLSEGAIDLQGLLEEALRDKS